MIQVNKIEPSFFTKKKKVIKNPKQPDSWSQISDIRSDLREHILSSEQDLMCIYCEKKISSDKNKSNIDHFKTRKLYPELSFEYSNLLVSCNSSNHCSYIKDSLPLTKEDYKNIINPIDKDVNESFSFAEFGDIIANNDKAESTINTFSLNHKSLTEERKTIIRNFEAFKDFEEEILVDAFNGHVNLIKYLKNNKN